MLLGGPKREGELKLRVKHQLLASGGKVLNLVFKNANKFGLHMQFLFVI
jgi:hypothetical protein